MLTRNSPYFQSCSLNRRILHWQPSLMYILLPISGKETKIPNAMPRIVNHKLFGYSVMWEVLHTPHGEGDPPKFRRSLPSLPQITIDRGQIGRDVGTGNDTAGSDKNGLLEVAVARRLAPEKAESFEYIDPIHPQEGAKSA